MRAVADSSRRRRAKGSRSGSQKCGVFFIRGRMFEVNAVIAEMNGFITQNQWLYRWEGSVDERDEGVDDPHSPRLVVEAKPRYELTYVARPSSLFLLVR